MRANYVQAVADLLREGKELENILTHLKQVLDQNGHSKLHRVILQDILKHISEKGAGSKPVVTVAHESSLHKIETEIKKALIELCAKDDYDLVIDETIIGGFKISHAGQLLDNSYKQSLLRVYRGATN